MFLSPTVHIATPTNTTQMMQTKRKEYSFPCGNRTYDIRGKGSDKIETAAMGLTTSMIYFFNDNFIIGRMINIRAIWATSTAVI